jgi:hypothetical protein
MAEQWVAAAEGTYVRAFYATLFCLRHCFAPAVHYFTLDPVSA